MRVAILFAMIWLVLGPTLAFAADTRGGDGVAVGLGETIGDELYLGGGTVTVLGTINGDLVVTGGTLTVTLRWGFVPSEVSRVFLSLAVSD